MDGSFMRHANPAALFSWPVIIIFMTGLGSIAAAIGVAAWWIGSHLSWVW